MAPSAFSTRIFRGMAAVVAVCTTAMLVSICPIIVTGVERSLVDRLHVVRGSFQRHLTDRYDLLESRVLGLVDRADVQGVLGADALDAEAIRFVARTMCKELDVDIVVLTGPTGEILAASHDLGGTGEALLGAPVLRRPLRGERFAGWYDDGRSSYLVGSAPVVCRGQFVGALMIGQLVGAALLDGFSCDPDVSLMVLRGGIPIATSSRSTRFDPAPFTRRLVVCEASPAGHYRIQDDALDRFAVVARVAPGIRVALSIATDELAELQHRLIMWVLGFALVAVGLSLLASLWVAQRLARPMVELALAADRVADGDWGTEVAESAMDETVRVARAFNHITRRARQLVQEVRSKAQILQRQRNELEWANQAKNNFLVSASHELRTPLTTIVSSSEILSQHGAGGDEETRMEFLRMIDVEAARIAILVDQFLDVSEMEAGELQLAFENFDFVAALRGLVEAFCTGAPDRPCALRTHLDRGMCVGDRKRLLQVVEQLLDNVAKFTPESSEVSISLDEKDGVFELRVADRGPGLASDEERERIFERFVQGGDILTEKPSGVGLGLSIARDVARAHAGDLRCEPNPGGGSVFVLTFAAQMSVAAPPR